ncbi:hypothetical protein SGPA1_11517 [Streptomyces misionensis JCM 4497]
MRGASTRAHRQVLHRRERSLRRGRGRQAGRTRPRHHQGHPLRRPRAVRDEGAAEQGQAAPPGPPQQGRGVRPQLRGTRPGAGQRGARGPVRLLQAVHLGHRPR